MATIADKQRPLVIVVGPTASGKTSLSIELAKRFNGEIISADSRAVYKGLSIGTAKPTMEERQGVPHWGFDLVSAGERFTASDYQHYARRKIEEIRSRGKLPFLVGGTGLYIDAVVYDFEFPSNANDIERRAYLNERTVEELSDYCNKNNIELPENHKNKRHLVNAILRKGQHLKRSKELPDGVFIVGITTDKEVLRERIRRRAGQMFESEVVAETIATATRFGWEVEAMTGNIYPIIRRLQDGELSRQEAEDLFVVRDWQLAKRQMTWFRRNRDIKWFSLQDAHTYIAHILDRVNNS